MALFFPDERDGPALQRLRDRLDANTPVHVPAHWWVELTNGVPMAERRKRVSLAVGMEALSLIPSLNVLTDDETATRMPSDVAALARQQNLTGADRGGHASTADRV